jgi:hypothetical protein
MELGRAYLLPEVAGATQGQERGQKEGKAQVNVYFYYKNLYYLCQSVILMTVTSNDRGQQNMWAKEPQMYTDPNKDFSVTHNEKAEKLNGRLAMLGVMAALGAYALTGQIIPGVW